MTVAEKTPVVAILGAGPAGLMLARHLTLANIPFKVFERDESPETRQVSGTLDVHPSMGQLALKEAGLLEQFNAIARHGVRTRFVDAQAQTIVDFDDEAGTDEERPEIDRMDLQRILQGSISLNTVQWGFKIQAVKRDSYGDIAIHMANGEVESGFRLVVGADGAWSKVRNLFTSIRPKYSGTTLFSTIIHPQDAMYSSVASLVHQGNYMGLQNGQAIYMFYLGDGTYHVSVGTQLAERRAWDEALLSNPEELWKILKSDFEGWTSELTDPITKSERGFRPWPLYNMPMEGVSWEPVPGATLVGDAAHLTIPTGDGVNHALFDSFELSKQIIKHWPSDIDQAIAEYEKAMIPRARKAIKMGEWMTEVMYGPGAPHSFLEAIGAKMRK